MKRLTVIFTVTVVAAIAVVSTAHAAEPAPKNASQWCKTWAKGEQLPTMNQLFGAGTYKALFEKKTKSGKTKKNLHGACVSATAKKLAAAKKADDEADDKAESAATAACKKELQANATKFAANYESFGQCVRAKQGADSDEDDD
ncbi:MAG: hypothetical protein ACRC50_08510 [Gaiella sp.]